MTTLRIRNLEKEDCGALLVLVRALAQHHGNDAKLHATAEMFEHEFFKPGTAIGAIVAEAEAGIVGCAVWHRSFSTFRGKEVLYLEDLSVLPSHRNKGIGRILMQHMARLAKDMDAASIYWIMMGWNERGRRFYEGLGAEIEDNNCLCSIHGDALEALANG